MGETMATSTFIAAVISGGAIIFLSSVEPAEQKTMAIETNMSPTAQYLAGIGLMIIAVAGISGTNIACRFMQSCNSMLLQIPYNAFTVVVLAPILLYNFVSKGLVPYSDISDMRGLTLLVISGFFNFAAQIANFYANQQASPSIVSVLGYVQVAFSFFFDMIIFDVVPTSMQYIAISILLTSNITYFSYKLY